MGIFNNIFVELAEAAGNDGRLMIDATHLKAHRTAASLFRKGLFPNVSTHKKRAEFKTPAQYVTVMKTFSLALTAGQVSDYDSHSFGLIA